LPANVSDTDEFRRGLSALQAGRLEDAERAFKADLRGQPKHAAALNLLGVVLTQRGKFAEAETYFRRALAQQPQSEVTLYNYGLALKALKRPAEALQCFTQALAVNSAVAETWNNRGTVFGDLKRHDEAIADFDRAIALNPRYADALCNKGNSLTALKRYDEGFSAFAAALALKPDLAEAWIGCGNVRFELKRHDDALAAYDKASALRADLAEAWHGRGKALGAMSRFEEAAAAFDRALALKPDFAEAWLGRGHAFFECHQYDNALFAYDKAIELKPGLADAWLGRGIILFDRKRHQDALTALEQALTLNPEVDYAAGHRLLARMQICEWTNLEAQTAQLLAAVRQGKPSSVPFVLVTLPSSAADQLQCARRFVRNNAALPPLCHGAVYSHERIRVAYVSADFHEHATGHLAAGLFEQHDKTRFDVTAISFGPDDGSGMRRRISQAFERFVDVRDQSDQEVAELIRRLEIDISVDLKGHTQNARLGILARRAAPIQVNYLGYPGTMGADYIDYILADSTIIPKEHFAHFSENVVWLPDSYQVNDDKRSISQRAPSRHECELPNDAFVFCSFNDTYKVFPEIFDIWMRLLAAKQNSVLWLIDGNSTARQNLRTEAKNRGISPERLIFAPRMPLPDHLARHRHADLFLDTLPCNAHTTASDALWAGVPVLTCLGATFAGRVAASLLRAIGLDELITHSLQDYEVLARKLAGDTAQLRALKDRLAGNRTICPLFDTERSTRHIEAAYVAMWERCQRGERPQAFSVNRIE